MSVLFGKDLVNAKINFRDDQTYREDEYFHYITISGDRVVKPPKNKAVYAKQPEINKTKYEENYKPYDPTWFLVKLFAGVVLVGLLIQWCIKLYIQHGR